MVTILGRLVETSLDTVWASIGRRSSGVPLLPRSGVVGSWNKECQFSESPLFQTVMHTFRMD